MAGHTTHRCTRATGIAKTVTFVPGIGYCRTSEAMPYLRRLFDAQIRKCEAHLAEFAETEKLIGACRDSNRDEVIREAAEHRRALEEIIASSGTRRPT